MSDTSTVDIPARTGTQPHCVAFSDGRRSRVLHDLDSISEVIKEPGNVVWLDLVEPQPRDFATLQREFNLHPLAIEDAQTPHERPKLEAYEGYLFLIVHPVTWEDERLIVHELAIFAGRRYMVTIHKDPKFALTETERRWHVHDGEIGQDSGFLLYTLLDTIVDNYFLISDRLEEWINELQTHLFEDSRSSSAMLREIIELKKDVHDGRRAVTPMRDVLQPIIRGDLKFLDKEEILYYRDVYDHVVRVIDQLDSARDLISSALEIHLSLVANRQNEVAKQLAIIATIFLPLTYLTGFFGQNFGYMVNSITSPQIFWWLGIGSQVAGLVILLGYFRLKRWF